MTAASHSATILIVDDTPANLGVIVEGLEGHGLRVVVAQQGEEALQRADYVHPDLILLDVMMPGMNGFEICRRLKAQERTRDIPVIFMTSLASLEDKITGFAVGGVDYVTKPLQVAEVRARVDTHLSLRAMRKQLEAQNEELHEYRKDLERQVAERTAELSDANEQLLMEVEERRRAEENVRRLNAELEVRVAERTAQLKATNEELEAFSYCVSHDLRAPLRAISGFAQVLIESHSKDLGTEGLGYVNNMLLAGRRLESLIQDLLNYARTGRGTLRTEPVPLAPLLQQLEAMFGARVSAAGARFEVATPLATPLGDATLIGQILTNLIDNAIKYRRRDAVPIVRISTVATGDSVVLQVTDNGIGIARESQDKIFQMFQRAQNARDYPGTGIGLAIVAKAARAMGGEVSVDSSPDQGSTFRVQLPAATEGMTEA